MENLFRVTAFPKTKDGGNKAGVYINADKLLDAEMQDIAEALGYSETAFISRSDKADFKLQFFTPLKEVDLCGHATIASFNLMRDIGIISNGEYTQETKAGILKLKVESDIVFMEQPSPKFGEIVSSDEIHACFDSLNINDFGIPQIVSTGLREIFLPINNLEILNTLKPNYNNIISLSKKYNIIGIHAFSFDKEIDAYGRNFAPIVGINEESATGTSNGALACLIYNKYYQKSKYVLRQGYSMNLPSEIIAILDTYENIVKRVWVGGPAKIIK